MKKDFDGWNERKKRIHAGGGNKHYHEREVWWLSLGCNVGYEQDGAGEDFERPVLFLKGFSRFVCLVVPLTTSKKENPYHVSVGVVDGKQAVAIFSQLRLVDTRRLVNKVGMVDMRYFEAVRKAAKGML